jgi:hypothetical protein
MSSASQSRCRFIKVKPSLFHAREMLGLAVYAILFIDVELPNDDAHVVRRKDLRRRPLTVRELTLDQAVGFERFGRFKVASGQGILD